MKRSVFESLCTDEFTARSQRQTCPTSLIKLQWPLSSKVVARSCTCKQHVHNILKELKQPEKTARVASNQQTDQSNTNIIMIPF